MKEKTLKEFATLLEKIDESGMSISAYCDTFKLNKQSIYCKWNEFEKTADEDTPYYNEIMNHYYNIKENGKRINSSDLKSTTEEKVDSDNYTEVSYERDDNDHILYYSYKIYRKNKAPLVGKFSRDETNIVYRLYSYYGASLTQREVSRYFPELSLVDFKRILSAMNIYKASAPFAPHIIEEKSTDDLREMQLREKENDFLKKIEEDKIRNNEKLLKKVAAENYDLKKQLDGVKNLQFKLIDCPSIEFTGKISNPVNRFINVYLADMHIGASMASGTLYAENVNYGYEEAHRRLGNLLQNLAELGTFDKINICLMGDMLDSCGPTNKTARLDHTLPENMDGYEQANAYITLIHKFVYALSKMNICNKIALYSVRCGNHTGVIEYVATRALFAEIGGSNIKTTLFNTFFGSFKEGNHTFVLTHGKDDKFMKKGLPLILDDKNKVMIYEWLEDNNITGDNIHIIKGDLHSSNYSSCKKFDYRNVLSLFGASDYSAFNFSRNSYGVSYDLCIGGNIVRGEFQNM